MEHTRHQYLKDPPLAGLADFGLVDAPAKPVVSYPTPLTVPVDPSQMTPGDGMVDLTSYDEEEQL